MGSIPITRSNPSPSGVFMTPERIPFYDPHMLTQAQRERCFEYGYVSEDSLVPSDQAADLLRVPGGFVETSRSETLSGSAFDLGPGQQAGEN